MMPDLFEQHQEDLQAIFKHKAKTTDTDHAALLSARRIERARAMMAPFILRRKKHQVAKYLPPQTFRTVECEMTEAQKEVYEEYMSEEYKMLMSQAARGGNNMTALRQAAIHRLCLKRIYDEDVIVAMAKAAADSDNVTLSRSKWKKHHDRWMDMSDGRLNKLCHDYPDVLYGPLDILEVVFEAEGIKSTRLDGSDDTEDRQSLIDIFHHDESIDVMLLTTKAGGTGINLPCANKVILFDMSFNPQDDVQAGNRAHRIGQTKPVEVITLVTKGTIEEQIFALRKSKLALEERVTGDESTQAAGQAAARAEQKGLEMIEDMLREKIKEESPVKEKKSSRRTCSKDVKDEFMDGLKSAGFDMSAA